MPFFDTKRIPKIEMLPGIHRQAVTLDDVMMTFFSFEPGSVVPEHSHPHQQITYVIEGAAEFHLGGEVRILRTGEGACCPPNVPHKMVVLDEPTTAVDAWYPPREEYR
jgi:quercetin dioxygenase-like cupin family protein